MDAVHKVDRRCHKRSARRKTRTGVVLERVVVADERRRMPVLGIGMSRAPALEVLELLDLFPRRTGLGIDLLTACPHVDHAATDHPHLGVRRQDRELVQGVAEVVDPLDHLVGRWFDGQIVFLQRLARRRPRLETGDMPRRRSAPRVEIPRLVFNPVQDSWHQMVRVA
jgi:hypothetical protein